jgi:hypothetical protein
MRVVQDASWRYQGFTLLWDAALLGELASSASVLTIRQLTTGARKTDNERALLITGVDGAIDALSPADAETWLEHDLRRVLLMFQDEFESQRALILWLPSGRSRIAVEPASQTSLWRCAAPHDTRTLPIGRILWAGAESDVARVVRAGAARHPDGDDWVGLHLRRVS